MHYTFSAYGIQVCHPNDWRIFINPRKPFGQDAGMVKIEKLAGQTSLVSLAVSWNSVPETVTDFVRKYLEEVEDTYATALKNKTHYSFQEKSLFSVKGRQAGFIRSSYLADTHIIKALGRKTRLSLLQTVQFCPQTNRTLVGTVTAYDAYVKEHEAELLNVLFSLGWHSEAEEKTDGTPLFEEPWQSCGGTK